MDIWTVLPFAVPGFLILWGCIAGNRALTRNRSPASSASIQPDPNLPDASLKLLLGSVR